MSKTKPLIILFIVLATLSGICLGADKESKFAVKSVGTLACQRFLTAREAAGSDYALYGGHLAGYISACNQLVPDTFDVTPWQNMDTLAVLTDRRRAAA